MKYNFIRNMKSKKTIELKSKLQSFYSNQKKYKIFKSKQLLGLILTILSAYFFVVSIVQVSGFTTIYSYTFGFLFGYYSYFIFVALIYFGLTLIFNIDIWIEKFLAKRYNRIFNFSWFIYLLFVIGIALVIESSIQIHKNKNAFPGVDVFELSITNWWEIFTSSSNASLPNVQNAGFIVNLCVSLIAFWAGFPVSIIIGVICILYFGYYLYYGSLITTIKNSKIDKNKMKKAEVMEHKTRILDLSFENDNILDNKEDLKQLGDEELQKTVTIDIDNVNNIFDVNEINKEQINEEFIKDKTTEINIKNDIAQKFNIDDKLNEEKKHISNETFEFELDIFDTITETIVDDNITDNKFSKDNNRTFKK